MPTAELINHVQRVFEAEEAQNGQTNHRSVARALVGNDSRLRPSLGRDILRMETRAHVYEGAQSTLDNILTGSDDKVLIWTQGNPTVQLWKVAMSGVTDLRRAHGKERFSVFAAEDKITTLPNLLDAKTQDDTKRVIIVDDKAENIVRVAQVARAWKQQRPMTHVEIIPVWINQGRTKDQVPEGYTLQAFTREHVTIQDIRELLQLHDPSLKTSWLIDWDHTLNNTADAKRQLFHDLASHIVSEHPSPLLGSYQHDLQAGIVGASRFTDLPNGMSGRRVIEAQHDRSAIVVKHAKGSPKTLAEIQGVRHLQQMPHRDYMPGITYLSEEEGIIAMEKVEGESGRQKIQNLTLTSSDIQAVDRLLDMKLRWLRDVQQGQQVAPEGLQPRSMQREELGDTHIGIIQAVNNLSDKYGIASNAIGILPLFFSGQMHISASVALERLQRFYRQTESDPRLPLHGDVSWGNMIFGNNRVALIDGEWTGLHDPSEAYARIAKVVSTTTAPPHSIVGNLTQEHVAGQAVLHVATNDPFPDEIHKLQHHMLQRGQEFGKTLGDNTFMQKLYMYLAGSYARELAIANRRSMGADEQLFALTKMVELIELSGFI